MNKNLIILIIAIALGVGGYYIYSGGQKEGMEHASGMADDAGNMADDAAKATEDAAAKATDAAADTAKAAADAATDAAKDAADQATDAVQTATDAAKDAASQATDAAQSAADQATDAAQSAADAAKDAVANMSPADLLKPENFDMEKVTGLLDAASVPDDVKTGLKAALDSAKDNPEMLKEVLGMIKTALGL